MGGSFLLPVLHEDDSGVGRLAAQMFERKFLELRETNQDQQKHFYREFRQFSHRFFAQFAKISDIMPVG